MRGGGGLREKIIFGYQKKKTTGHIRRCPTAVQLSQAKYFGPKELKTSLYIEIK